MSKQIADILGINPLNFRNLIEEFEKRSGRNAQDIRLYSDMRSRAQLAASRLGLDPTDTISSELYFALNERARADNISLSTFVNVAESDPPEIMTKKVVEFVTKNLKMTKAWSVKQAVLRSYLKSKPPKAVMKAIGLRSTDSMLKRVNPTELLTLAAELEKPDWQDKFLQQYKRFSPTDFDEKTIIFNIISKERVVKIEKAGYPINKLVTPNFVIGSISVMPSKVRFPLDVLALVLSCVEAVSEVRKQSAYFRLLSVRKDFGDSIYRVAKSGVASAKIGYGEIGWNSIHRHLVGNQDIVGMIEAPFLSEADFQSQSAVEFLAAHDPRFEFWEGLDYVFYGASKEPKVSLNIMDVVTNSSNRLSLDKAHRTYAHKNLWDDLWLRYLSHDQVLEDVLAEIVGSNEAKLEDEMFIM